MIFAFWKRRRAEHDAFLKALEAVVEVSREQSRAVEALADAIKAQYDAYKPSDRLPVARVHDDLTELALEQERLKALADSGFPLQADPIGQYDWLAREMDFDPLRVPRG